MFFELKLAVHHQLVAESESMLILDLLRLLAPFSELPSSGIILPDWDTVWNLMSQDKKIRFGQIQWSVPAGIGQGITGLEIPFDCLKELYEGWSANPWE
jgi:3-dehydroquinate synthetase